MTGFFCTRSRKKVYWVTESMYVDQYVISTVLLYYFVLSELLDTLHEYIQQYKQNLSSNNV